MSQPAALAAPDSSAPGGAPGSAPRSGPAPGRDSVPGRGSASTPRDGDPARGDSGDGHVVERLPGGYAELTSGEGVELDLRLAGPGSRLVASVVDLLVMYGAYILLSVVVVLALSSLDGAAQAAVTVTVLVLIFAGYPILTEWLFHGRTLGKMAMGLRVVRDDGGPIGFRQALVRGLAGLLLEKPGLLFPVGTATGVITMTFTQRSKRLGDLMAGTVVAAERAGARAASPLPRFGVPAPLQPWAATVDLRGIDDALAASLRDFVGRATGLSPGARHALEQDLLPRVLDRLAPWPPAGTPIPIIFSTVLAERRRRAEFGRT